jgi:hypothetical protein
MGFYLKTLQSIDLPRDCSVLVIGGGSNDIRSLNGAKFTDVTISNIDATKTMDNVDEHADGNKLPYPDASYDFVVANATLHHMSRPHGCICEMHRVAKRAVLFLESQESFFMKLAVNLGLVARYEHNAIVDSNYTRGGVDDLPLPNYVYRWTRNEVRKLLNSFDPTVKHEIKFFSEWNIEPWRIQRRIAQHRPWLNNKVFYAFLWVTGKLVNLTISRQGNEFAAFIDKRKARPQPWIDMSSGSPFLIQDHPTPVPSPTTPKHKQL